MNIFVLCTGRCGSVTFIRACRHITNYTSGHETRSCDIGRARLVYPPGHIEADNRLAWLLGRLDRAYGNSAFYVHLKRDLQSTAQSFAKRHDKGIMRAYQGDGIIPLGYGTGAGKHLSWDRRLEIAIDYCRTVDANIELFLGDKTKTLTVGLESIEKDFALFWEQCQADGDLRSAILELRQKHNSTEEIEGRPRAGLGSRLLSKAGRLVKKFPTFVRNA